MLRRTITCNFIITVTFVTVKLFLTSDMVFNFGFFIFKIKREYSFDV